MVKKLDSILLSENAKELFLQAYSEPEFHKWIMKILPEIERCKNQKQDNPWHIYNCLEHILVSVEEMNKQTDQMEENVRRKLAYCMFLHDIGKPHSYIRRFSKAYGRDVDSFFNHNKKSAEIAKRVLPELSFSNEEIRQMTKLIYKHDIFMFISLTPTKNQFHKELTPQLIEEEIKDLNNVGDGSELLRQLILIGRADNKAQNPEMTQESLKLLQAMEDMVQRESSGQEK